LIISVLVTMAALWCALGSVAESSYLVRTQRTAGFFAVDQAGQVLVLPFAVVAVAVAFTSHPAPLTWLAPVTMGVHLVSAVVLPAVPWVRAPGRSR
jgi:hypothetical protein